MDLPLSNSTVWLLEKLVRCATPYQTQNRKSNILKGSLQIPLPPSDAQDTFAQELYVPYCLPAFLVHSEEEPTRPGSRRDKRHNSQEHCDLRISGCQSS